MTTPLVLDAWAILAFLQQEEPAASRVKQILIEAQRHPHLLHISIINLGEIFYRIGRLHGLREAERTIGDLRSMPLNVLPANEDLVFEAATLKTKFPISYADAFAAAAARRLKGILLTGDPELLRLRKTIRIRKLTRKKK